MHRLKDVQKKVIGYKQTLKMIERGQAAVVYVAKDGEDKVRRPLLEMSAKQGVPIVEADSMMDLGKACNIQVGASAVAILKD